MIREGIEFEMLMVEGKKEAEQWKIVMEQEGCAKAAANEKLIKCNLKYHKLMKQVMFLVALGLGS